jgi:hypothetical protein
VASARGLLKWRYDELTFSCRRTRGGVSGEFRRTALRMGPFDGGLFVCATPVQRIKHGWNRWRLPVFRAASLPGPTRPGTVSAHLFAYQLTYGVIPRLGWSGTEDSVICHQCDFTGCVNPAHMRLGTNAVNRFEYLTRRRNLTSPLADVRGAAGRTRAIAGAIREGLQRAEAAHVIEQRIVRAELAGLPLTLW